MATPLIYINLLSTPKTNWQWNTLAIGNYFFNGVSTSSGSINAEVVFPFYAQAGTYTLDLVHGRSNNRGIYTVQIDDATVGTIDGYNATFSATRSSITGIVIAATGVHEVRLVMATKNASSSSYFGTANAAILTRTGA